MNIWLNTNEHRGRQLKLCLSQSSGWPGVCGKQSRGARLASCQPAPSAAERERRVWKEDVQWVEPLGSSSKVRRSNTAQVGSLAYCDLLPKCSLLEKVQQHNDSLICSLNIFTVHLLSERNRANKVLKLRSFASHSLCTEHWAVGNELDKVLGTEDSCCSQVCSRVQSTDVSRKELHRGRDVSSALHAVPVMRSRMDGKSTLIPLLSNLLKENLTSGSQSAVEFIIYGNWCSGISLPLWESPRRHCIRT